MELNNFLEKAFDKIGGNGPLIAIFANIFLMVKKPHFQFYYVLFALISMILNASLKQLIKQPRPSISKETFQSMLKQRERFVKRHGQPYDIFGMPSGHTQSMIYSTLFNYLVFKDVNMSIAFLLLSLLTMVQRVVYNHHTVLQIIAGGCVGILIAFVAFYFAKNNIVGKFTAKKDDDFFHF